MEAFCSILPKDGWRRWAEKVNFIMYCPGGEVGGAG